MPGPPRGLGDVLIDIAIILVLVAGMILIVSSV